MFGQVFGHRCRRSQLLSSGGFDASGYCFVSPTCLAVQTPVKRSFALVGCCATCLAVQTPVSCEMSSFFSVAQENDNCQPLVPAGTVGCLCASLPVFMLLLFQLARSPHRLESPWGCQCHGLLSIAESFDSISCCVRLRKRSVLFVKSFACARCRVLLVCPFTCETCPC